MSPVIFLLRVNSSLVEVLTTITRLSDARNFACSRIPIFFRISVSDLTSLKPPILSTYKLCMQYFVAVQWAEHGGWVGIWIALKEICCLPGCPSMGRRAKWVRSTQLNALVQYLCASQRYRQQRVSACGWIQANIEDHVNEEVSGIKVTWAPRGP